MEKDDTIGRLEEQHQALRDQLTKSDQAGSFLNDDLVSSTYDFVICIQTFKNDIN